MTEEKTTCSLSRAMAEDSRALWYVEKVTENDLEAYIDPDILKLLLRMAEEKIEYLDEKYDFEIDEDDAPFIEDSVPFLKRVGAEEAARKLERSKKEG